MNSLILLSLLVTTAHPDITYQIVTDDFHQHNTHSFNGSHFIETDTHIVYNFDMHVCNIRRNHHNMIDETILFRNRYPQKNIFVFDETILKNHCFLIITKQVIRSNTYYNGLDYWYPRYNNIAVRPHHPYRYIRHHRHSHPQTKRYPRRKIVVSKSHHPKFKRHTKQPRRHKKKHHRKRHRRSPRR